MACLLAVLPGPVGRAGVPGCVPLGARERVAQTIMSAIPGTGMDDLTRRIVTRHAGSGLLFGHNIEGRTQLRGLTGRLHRAAGPVRLLIAVDEEGGRVSRLGEAGLVSRLPAPRGLARTATVQDARRRGARLGREMIELGVDWNLAPVLDVTDAPDDSVIGDRSFSGRAPRAAAFGRAFAEGLTRAGVVTTGKHFPGHGRTSVDSHQTLPTVRTRLGGLRRHDLLPYRKALPFLGAVMAAHVRFTAIDRARPASLSPEAARLLRDELGFTGVLMTDALEMGAITNRWAVPEAAELALRAGADMVLVTDPTAADDVSARLLRALRAGRLRPDRLDEAAGRVLRLKGYTAEETACLLG